MPQGYSKRDFPDRHYFFPHIYRLSPSFRDIFCNIKKWVLAEFYKILFFILLFLEKYGMLSSVIPVRPLTGLYVRHLQKPDLYNRIHFPSFRQVSRSIPLLACYFLSRKNRSAQQSHSDLFIRLSARLPWSFRWNTRTHCPGPGIIRPSGPASYTPRMCGTGSGSGGCP